MYKSPSLFRLITFSLVLATSGCSWFSDGDGSPVAAQTLAPLEIPPDLIRPVGDPRLARPNLPMADKKVVNSVADCRCNDAPRIGERVLPQNADVQHMRDGQRRWLRVSVEPEQVWPLVRSFVEMRGYQIRRDEPAIGLLTTDWKNRYVDHDMDATNNGMANWREILRIRIEPAAQFGNTEIHLTQRNAERVVPGVTEESDLEWQLRTPDESRAIEMLNRLASYLVAEDVKDAVPLAAMVSNTSVDKEGQTVLLVNAPFDKVWRRLGATLKDLGFVIEDHNLSSRIYHVSNELPSNLSEENIKFGRPEKATVTEEYWLHVGETSSGSVISMHNIVGKAIDSTYTRHVLTLLQAQFQ